MGAPVHVAPLADSATHCRVLVADTEVNVHDVVVASDLALQRMLHFRDQEAARRLVETASLGVEQHHRVGGEGLLLKVHEAHIARGLLEVSKLVPQLPAAFGDEVEEEGELRVAHGVLHGSECCQHPKVSGCHLLGIDLRNCHCFSFQGHPTHRLGMDKQYTIYGVLSSCAPGGSFSPYRGSIPIG